MALKDKRKLLADFYKSNASYFQYNTDLLDIYSGRLRPYVLQIMKSSLSEKYFNAIKDRTNTINILPRYINKVSTTYSKPPVRTSEDKIQQDFVDFYSKAFNINNSGRVADTYSNLFKGFGWEPYIDLNGRPRLRELPFDRFFVYSESEVSPEEETIFVKTIGKEGDRLLFFAYTNEEFDAFYSDGSPATQYMIDNQGINLYGVIPFVYAKRDKNRLYPVQDTDIMSMTTSIPVMLSDGAGAQMFSAFSILYGIDLDSENLTMSPNAFWSFKSDSSKDKQPQIGVLKPQADTDKILNYVMSIFTFWLETKGIRVGSIGSANAGNFQSGISKIIDEMDVYEIKKDSIEWFKKDEEELWNMKMMKVHNQWIKSGMVSPASVPGLLPETTEMNIEVIFEQPAPMVGRSEEIATLKAEIDAGLTTKEEAIRIAHPDYDEAMVQKTKNEREIF